MDRPVAVIMGLSITALGVVRSLGRRSIEVIGVDYEKQQIGRYSKFCKAIFCPNPEESPKDLLVFMKNLQNKLSTEAVLIPTSDEFVRFVSENRSALTPHYKFMLPSPELVEKLNDKREFYSIARNNGIHCPEVFSPRCLEDVIDISKEIGYPCVIKPAFGSLYKHLHFKAIMAKTSQELLENYRKYQQYIDKTLIQEFVLGRDDAQYSLATYFNANSEPLVTFTSRKVRQTPPGFGTGTFVTNCLEPEIERIGISFLKKLNYKGIAEVEFKRDSRDRIFKMIEVNTRIWTQNNLAMRCGIDIAYAAYIDMTGGRVERSFQKEHDIKWINFYDDFFACFGSSGYLRKREITLVLWLKSLMGRKEYAIFALDDIKPFIYATKAFIIKILSKVLLKQAPFSAETLRAKNK